MSFSLVFVFLFSFNFFDLSMSAELCNGKYCTAVEYCERTNGPEYCATYAGANKPCSFGWCPGTLQCKKGYCVADNGGRGEYCDGVHCRADEYCVHPPQPADAPLVKKYCARTNTIKEGELCNGVACPWGQKCHWDGSRNYCIDSVTLTNTANKRCSFGWCPAGQTCARGYCVADEVANHYNRYNYEQGKEYCNGKYCESYQYCIKYPSDGGAPYCANRKSELCNGVACPWGQKCHWDGFRNYCIDSAINNYNYHNYNYQQVGEYCNGKYCERYQYCIHYPSDGGAPYCANRRK